MTARAGARAAGVAAGAWALVLIAFGLLGSFFDPLSQDTELLVLVIVSSFLGALAGTWAGAWQARRAGAWAPGLGLVVPALVVVLLGVLLTAGGGGTNDASDTALIYAAFPAGAVVGAVVYGRRWLTDSR
ncbi:hypothetical protein [Solirubrobacter soli]|uniref:hypothetical protein n=1 Tax=Solirubrobacter soli TaxID=363832 RepID=UPI0003FD74EE|nr:hypothetical protein [Solirubrobacter soli]